MIKMVVDAVTEAFKSILITLLSPLLTLVETMLNLFATSGAIRDITHMPWVQQLISNGRVIAVSLLILRTTWEAYQLMALKADGAPTDVSGLAKRVIMSAAAIFAFPEIVRYLIQFGNGLALAVANTGFGVDPASVNLDEILEEFFAAKAVAGAATIGIFPLVVIGGIFLFLFLIFMQALARTVEITLSAIVGPWMALGYMSSGGGTAAVWWRESIVISLAHAVQMLLLYMSVAFGVGPGFSSIGTSLRPFFFIASLWITFKTPQILRNYAYSTGMRGAAGSIGNIVMWRTFSKLPF